jgi:hypothetical protein
MSEFIEVKVSELSGEALNWTVAKAVGEPVEVMPGMEWKSQHVWTAGSFNRYRPSTDWSQGGPLIEKYLVDLHYPHGLPGRGWWAQAGTHSQDNPLAAIDATPLIAACRAIVASVLGPVVSVPKELV